MENSVPSDYEMRAVIKFLNADGVTRLEIHHRLGIVYDTPYPSLKRDLGGRHFTMEENLQNVVAKFFAKQDTEWYSTGIHKLILCYNKCFDEQGNM